MSRVFHLVPHTHWDREWYRTFQQFRIRLVRLMDRLLDILANDDGYAHFLLDGQTLPLEDYLEIRPERADEIAQWVRAGRLSIGPWYVLADEFLVAPESLVRNLMLGDRVCRRFGARMPVGYVPDLFGHISQLPQILRGFAIEASVLRRGLAEEPVELWWEAPDGSRVLACYLRNGYDNATRLPMTNPDAFVAAIRSAADRLTPHVGSGQVLLMAGNDHQEPDPRLPGLIAYANDGRLGDDRLVHSSLPAYVASVREAVESCSLTTVKGELRSPQRHHLLPGVLSTRMWIKQRNDAIETLLTRWTEPFAAWAELLDVGDAPLSESHTHLSGHEPLAGVHQTAPLIRHAWRMLLENHPHDSICGCSVDQVHREMALRFDQAEQIAEEIATLSLAAIADQVDTSQDGVQPLVVFNPTGGPRTDVVTARLCLPDALEVVGPDGRVLPHQVATEPIEGQRLFFHREVTPDEMGSYLSMVRGGRLLNHVIHQVQVRPTGQEIAVLLTIGKRGTPNRAQVAMAQAQIEELVAQGNVSRFVIHTVMAEPSDLTFIAPEVPPHGYATFTIRPAQQPPAAPKGEASPPSDPLVLENDLFALQVEPSDGTLTLTDKTSGAVYPGLNRFVDGGDRGDEYNYCQPEQDRIVAGPVAPASVRVVRRGPVWQTLEIAQVYRLPRSLRPERESRTEETVDVPIVSRVSIYAGVRRVEFETTVDNQAQNHRLRVHFPVPVRVDHGHTEAHFHVARRPVPQVLAEFDTSAWIEQPVPTIPQRGWADVSGQAGLMVANRGLPEVELIPGDDETTIALTLLRCVGWLSRDDLHCRRGRAGPLLPTPEAQCSGRHTFHYALIPHSGRWEDARAQGEAFRAPLRAVAAEVCPGALPPIASLVQADPPSFALTAIKQPEDGSALGMIVRGVNLSDGPVTVRLRPWRAFERAIRTNLNEAPLESLSLDDDGAVTFSARSWEIVTIRWEGIA
jgi:mannosylglycerate hydrolase